MRTGLVVFARFGSSRLPGKALLPIGSRPLLGHVLDRTKRVRGDHPIVIATSIREVDDGIAAFAQAEGVQVFRGEAEDVAQRALACARAFRLDTFARICGDRPFHDPCLIQTLIERMGDNELDLATNSAIATFPNGMTAEIVRTEALARALRLTDDVQDREHVTRYFYNHADEFHIFNLRAPCDSCDRINLAVDTAEDLERIRWMVGRLENPAFASCAEVVALARAWAVGAPDMLARPTLGN